MDNDLSYVVITILVSNLVLPDIKNYFIKTSGAVVSNWERENRCLLFSRCDIPNWLLENVEELEVSDNYRLDYAIHESYGMIASFSITYKLYFTSKIRNKLKLYGHEISKHINNPEHSLSRVSPDLIWHIDFAHDESIV